MQGLMEDYEIEILAISMLTKTYQTAEFVERVDIPYLYLIDTDFKVVKDYMDFDVNAVSLTYSYPILYRLRLRCIVM